MATLEDLLTIDGVAGVGEFRSDGSLVDFKTSIEMAPDLTAMPAQSCATVSMLFGAVSGAFTQPSATSWSPPKGWIFAGGDRTVAVAGNKGAFVQSEKADFNRPHGALAAGK